MTAFNRIVTTLLLLALIPIVVVALIVPRPAVQLLVDELTLVEEQLDRAVPAWEMLVRIGLALLIGVGLVFLIFMELRRSPSHGVPIRQIKGGEALIAIDSIVDRLNYKIDRLPGVLDVQPNVTTYRKSVEVVLDIETVADANMRANIEEISAVARQVVEEEMGLKLKGKPRLNLRTVIYPEPVSGAEIQEPGFAPLDEPAPYGQAEPALPELAKDS